MTAQTQNLDIDYVLGLTDLPAECIQDCSRPGVADEAVSYWRARLALTVNPRRARQCLAGYGNWDEAELTAMDNAGLAEKVLWLACGDFSEFFTACADRGVDPYDPPADFDPPYGSDIFVLE